MKKDNFKNSCQALFHWSFAKKFVALVFFAISLSSCRWFTDASTPYGMGAGFKVPPGTPAFQQGYRDGCSFIFYARGNAYYRTVHKYKYNPKLASNPEYTFGYKRGGTFCFNYIVPGIRSFDTMLFPHKDPILAQDYNATGFMDAAGLDSPIPNPDSGGLDNIFSTWSGGSGGGVFSANPLWAGGSKGQFFGQ